MFKRTLSRAAVYLGVALAIGATTTGCSKGGEGAATVANVKPSAMPDGGDWAGVYYHQVYGFLHLTESAGAVQGAWRTTAGDKWGEMYGEADGDLLRFTWKEHKIGIVGPSATSEGKGYFKYSIPNPEEAHELTGEWGLGDSDAGHGWNCVKQLNQEPDPKSVRPNELESRVGASGFDGSAGDADIGPQDEPAEGEEGEEGAGEEGEETPGEEGMDEDSL